MNLSGKHKGASIVALLTGLVALLMLHRMSLLVTLITLQGSANSSGKYHGGLFLSDVFNR